MFALVVSSCIDGTSLERAVNKFDWTIRLFTRLFKKDGCSHDITILLQPRVVIIVVCIRVVSKTL